MINAMAGSSMQVLNVAIGFISRTIFIYLLNSDYLGVNSLYTNILNVLSFAELGIGSAIVFSLYKPIAENDRNKIHALMKFYRTAYWIIGSVIFFAGICVIPFMNYIIKNPPDVKENLILVYFLFLFNTSVSYFFSYKKTLITANQKDYLVQIYTNLFQLLKMALATVLLVLTHEYLVYLVVQIFCTIALNVSLSLKADKLYPFLRDRNDSRLSKKERSSIFSNVQALFIYKFGSVVLNGTDNIIISSLINISAVGVASNYTMLTSSVSNVIGQAINSLTASVGNLSVQGEKDQIKSVMHELLLLCVWLYGFIAIGFAVLANDFVYLWLGTNYVLQNSVVMAIVFSLYINGVQYAAYTFRTTQGLFRQSRFVPLISALLNIVLSIWWGKLFGLAGIFVATGVSRLLTTTIVDPWLVYKNNFNERPYEYYCRYMMETCGVIMNYFFQIWVLSLIHLDGWTGFFIKFFIVCITINLVSLLEFFWTREFKGLKNRFLLLLRKKVLK